MATIPWLADVLRQAGIQVVEHGDWRNRMRPGSFDPIGVLWHHTAARSSATNPHPALSTCINGRSDLPGPLCHALVDYHGVFHVISAGRANHAGTSRGSGQIPAGDGNAMLVGWEIDYDGQGQQMTAAQYSASLTATAAVVRRPGRDAGYARGHRETSTTGKIDPSGIDLDRMRADVAARLAPLREFGLPGKSGVSYGNSTQIFAVNAAESRELYQRVYVPGEGWREWANIGGGPITGDPVAIVNDGNMNVFARNNSGNVIFRPYQPGHGWHDWANLGGVIIGNPDAVDYGGYFELIARSTDNNLYQMAYTPGHGWHEWTGHGGGPFTSDPVAVGFRSYLNVFGRRSNGNVAYRGFDPNLGWQDWYNLGGNLR